MTKATRPRKSRSGVFQTMRLLEKAHIPFHILRSRDDALTLLATIVGERIEIDIFEDDHIELTRFRGDESIEGGMELLAEIVGSELKENYPEQLSDKAAE